MTKRPSDPHRRRILKLDEEFREWVRHQPSAYSGGMDYDPDSGRSQNEACHRRRAATSGVGYKPLFDAISLRHDEHHLQTVQGESEVGGKNWWDRKAAESRERWLATLTLDVRTIVTDWLETASPVA